MVTRRTQALKPRKTPIQKRASATLEALFEATIQVLLQGGFEKLTTTRVAERAGVSVGSLYQYFPNKQALLLAVLEKHLNRIVVAVEQACEAHHGDSLEAMITAVCHAFIDAKTAELERSRALHFPAKGVGGDAVVQAATKRTQLSLIRMLSTAKDARFRDLSLPAMILTTALVGPLQAALESDRNRELVQALRGALVDLYLGYLERIRLA